MSVTFKKHPKEGPYRSFQNDFTDIKVKRKIVGLIIQTRDTGYRVSIRIKDDAQSCGWRFARLLIQFPDEDAARRWVTKHWDSLCSQHTIIPQED